MNTIENFKCMLWTIVLGLLIISGIYFTYKLKGKQFNIYKMISVLKKNTTGISSIGSLMLSLAGKIGISSISGVTLPFLSHGGSSLLISMINIGLLLNISQK